MHQIRSCSVPKIRYVTLLCAFAATSGLGIAAPLSRAAGAGATPTYVVTVNTDNTGGTPSNCTGAGTPYCSLRDAVAAATAAGGGNITFSPTVFSASQSVSARTISLNDVIVITSNTTITGPTTGSGSTLTQLVTVTPLNNTAFDVNKGTAGVTISGLSISGYNLPYGYATPMAVNTDGQLTIINSLINNNVSGGEISGDSALYNDVDGNLTLTNSTVSNNFAYADFNDSGAPGGIFNAGTLVVTGSTFSGNGGQDTDGGAIFNEGTATLTNTTVSGNNVYFYQTGGRGGGIFNEGTLNLINSSVTGNGAPNPGEGSGIYTNGTLHVISSKIISNLSNLYGAPAVEDDCDGPGCPAEPIPAPPLITPPSGTYLSFDPGFTDTTPNTVFFFTTDGSTPTISSDFSYGGGPVYYLYLGTSTVKAIAFANGATSTVATAKYTVVTDPSACTLIDYSGGFTSGALSLNGGATLYGSNLLLTDSGFYEARSAFFSTPVPTTEFTTDFQFQMLYPLADGITFTIQSSSPTAVGQPGGGLGYAGIPKSVALKFDLFNNNGEGFDSGGFYNNGAYPSTPALNLFPYGINLHSGHVFAVHITYIGQVTTATITDLTTYQSYTASVPGDLTKVVGNKAYVGFTAGTGLLTATQEILTWTYGGGSGCGTTAP